ncbi:MAG: two-component regulator propeller domain-containing protein [Bacteroidota bacterium]
MFLHSLIKHRTFYLFCILACEVLCLQGQQPNLSFKSYGYTEGLADLRTYDIVQDSFGFIWVGTQGGLSRFDGYSFKNYQQEPDNPYSLSSNSTGGLLVDRKGNLWVGTRGRGLNFYDRKLDRFIRIPHIPDQKESLSNDYVETIFEDAEGTIWVGTHDGLNKLISWDPKIEVAQFERINSIPFPQITAIAEHPKGTYWLGTGNNGIVKYQAEKNLLSLFNLGNRDSLNQIINNNIKTLYAEPTKNRIWIGSYEGVNIIQNPETDDPIVTKFGYSEEDSIYPGKVFIADIKTGLQDDYWLSTYSSGLWNISFDEKEQPHFTHYDQKEEELNSLPSNILGHILLDKDKNLWTTSDKGISKVELDYQSNILRSFDHLSFPEGKNKLKDVFTIYEDSLKNLWLGTYGNGVWIYQTDSTLWKRIKGRPHSPKALTHSITTDILQDKEGTFWIATFGGFNKMKLEWEEGEPMVELTWYKHSKENPQSLSDNHVFCALDQDSVIWLGTRGGGLNKFDKRTESFQTYLHKKEDDNSLSNNYIWWMEEDSDHRIWMVTDGGLSILDPQSMSFSNFIHDTGDPYSISEDFLNFIYQDTKGYFWIGTNGSGLEVIHEDSIEQDGPTNFLHLGPKLGLSSGTIFGILEDDKGDMWISTVHGLTYFKASEWDYTEEPSPRLFQSFLKDDGILDNEFNSSACFKGGDGKLHFGNRSGLISIYPKNIARNLSPPKTAITSISVLGEKLRPGLATQKGRKPLNGNPNLGGQLHLTHKDLVLEIEFAALNYILSTKNQYAYKLEGFDEDWKVAGKERKATYTNLSEGHYTFRVKASNNDGVWNETGTSLRIYVAPPPWKTWWAYLIYVLIISSILYAAVDFRIKQQARQLETQIKIKQAKIQERERVRKDAAADFHDELGNKMTKISLFVELAKRPQSNQDQRKEFLDKIASQVRQLSDGMRDFIWVLDPEKDSLYYLMSRAKTFGEELFEHAGIELKIQGLDQDYQNISLPVDHRRHLLMMIKEAMHNILKYSQATMCTLSLSSEARKLKLSIQDNGQGFDLGEVRKGYGLKNLKMRADKIEGEIEIRSKIGEGTTIDLFLNYYT